MGKFITVVFTVAFVFFLCMVIFRSFGPFVFIFIVIAGVVSVLMNLDSRIEEIEKILGLKEEKDEEMKDQVADEAPMHSNDIE